MNPTNPAARKQAAVHSLAYLIVGAISPLTLYVAWHLRDSPHRLAFTGFSLWWLIIMIVIAPELYGWWWLFYAWIMGVGLFGIVIWFIKGWDLMQHGFNRKRFEQYATSTYASLKEAPRDLVHLGEVKERVTTVIPSWVGLHVIRKHLYAERRIFRESTMLLGSPGTGKSNNTFNLIEQYARDTDMDIIAIDGKGDLGTGEELADLLYHYRRRPVPVFKLGHENNGAMFDCFRGNADATFNQLFQLFQLDVMEGNAIHYTLIYENLLDGICHHKDGPPRSLAQVDERTNIQELAQALAHDPQRRRGILNLEKYDKDLPAIRNRINRLASRFQNHVGTGGFALDNSPETVFTLNTLNAKRDIASFLPFLLASLGNHLRVPSSRGVALFFDEFTIFAVQAIIDFLKQGRSRELHCFYGFQAIPSLGVHEKEIIALTSNFLLFSAPFTDDIVRLAGTKNNPHLSEQVKDGQLTGSGTVHDRMDYLLPPINALQLPSGAHHVIRKGFAVQVIAPLRSTIPHYPESVATGYIPQPKSITQEKEMLRV